MEFVSYDVVVCGAGTAGVAAAVAAARQGMKTIIVEKQCLLGGLATSGLIYVYLPLCDGYGKQILYGIAEEMLIRSVEYGPFDVPEKWGGPKGAYSGVSDKRYQCCFSPAGFNLTLDKMLSEANVDLLLDTMIIDAETEDDCLAAVTVINSSGRTKITGKCFIDTTGSAQVVQLAGGKIHRSENFITPWFIEMSEKPDFFHFTDNLHVQCEGAVSDKFKYEYRDSGDFVTTFVRKSWELIRRRYDDIPDLDRKKNYPVHLSAMPQLRKIGAINALYTLDDADHCKRFEDSIGLAPDWRKPDTPWDIPYRALVPQDIKNVLAAGRCMGALNEAWEVFRVIPTAVMTGEAAGLAASIAVKDCVTPADIDFTKLKKLLDKEDEVC
ncbi:MAG: FAD-dependent oxidoreductase [Lentisphaeria bacterium]|nr:FAD-dependent oxidoreductase [Lentisphaeria bacterium]